MTRISCAVVVQGDPATVFDYVSDWSAHAGWQRDLLWREDAAAADSSDEVSWTEIRRFAAREVRINVTVTEQARPDRITFVSESSRLDARGAMEFRAEGSRTRILQNLELRGHGLSALVVPFVARRTRQLMQANLYRLTMRFAQTTVDR